MPFVVSKLWFSLLNKLTQLAFVSTEKVELVEFELEVEVSIIFICSESAVLYSVKFKVVVALLSVPVVVSNPSVISVTSSSSNIAIFACSHTETASASFGPTWDFAAEFETIGRVNAAITPTTPRVTITSANVKPCFFI